MHIDSTYAKILTLPIILLFQYFFNKKFSFGDTKTLDKFFGRNWRYIVAYGLTYPLFMAQSTYYSFSDETDNILGGWLMSNHGEIVYRDFFSHHMPLPYFVSSIITFFTENNLNNFRLVFVSLCFLWLIFIARNLRQIIGDKLTILFIVTLALVQYLTWSHMILAETFIAYAVLHLTTIFILRSENQAPLKTSNVILLSILCAIPVLSALSYAPLSAVLYAISAYLYFAPSIKSKKSANLKTTIKHTSIMMTPYLLLGIWLTATNSLRQFIDQAYVFNKNYYSQFTDDVAKNMSDTLVNSTSGLIGDVADILRISEGSATFIATLSLLVIILYVLSLFFQKKIPTAIIITFIALTVSLRDNAILGVFGDGNNRISEVYASFVLLIAFLALSKAILHKFKMLNLESLSILLNGALSIALIFTVMVKGAETSLAVEREQAKGEIETGIQMSKDGGHIPRVINFVANEPGDYYWIGPFDFYSQLFINSNRSSQYTFFLPWQSVCEKCENDAISDLKKQKPKVIYWQHDMSIFSKDIEIDEYNKRIIDLFKNDYYTYKDDKYLKNFYFLKSDRDNIDKKLKDNNLFYTKQ